MATGTAATERRARRLREAEQRALNRWRPAQRWYHPLIARAVIAASRFITHRLNELETAGRERFEALRQRGERGLLTISNHVSLFDDPILTSSFVSGPYRTVRWVGADALNFFGSPLKSWLFTAGKSVPIIRGAGVGQPGMTFLRDRLVSGDWVHMFPEGGRTRDPEARLAGDFKSGTGWLVAEARPLVLPFYHYGMHRVLPVGSVRPRRGNRIRLLFGEPVDCDDAWIAAVRARHGDPPEGPQLWDAIAAELRTALADLERRVHPEFAGTQR